VAALHTVSELEVQAVTWSCPLLPQLVQGRHVTAPSASAPAKVPALHSEGETQLPLR
jgi:hypothetical protein